MATPRDEDRFTSDAETKRRLAATKGGKTSGDEDIDEDEDGLDARKEFPEDNEPRDASGQYTSGNNRNQESEERKVDEPATRAESPAPKRTGTSRRGFASMDKEKVRRIAAKGGRASHGGGRTRGSGRSSTSSH